MINSEIQKKIYLFALSNSNPKLLFDKKSIESSFKDFHSKKPKNLDLIFPVKSFPHTDYLKLIAPYLSGFELSNPDELSLVSDLIQAKTTLLLSNTFSSYDLDNFKENFIFDLAYEDQIELADRFKSLSIRISPPEHLEQGKNTRFGLKLDAIEKIAANHSLSDRIKSLHFHLGFEKNTHDDLIEAIRFAQSTRDKYFKKVKHFNIGGGLGPLSAEGIEALFTFIKSQKDDLFTIEAGRYFTEGSGFAVGQVLFITNDSIVLNLSRECHLKWSSPKSIVVLNKSPKTPKHLKGKINIYGLTSFEGDKIIECTFEKETPIAIGDYILFDNISGYSVAWNHSFNGLPPAQVVFI